MLTQREWGIEHSERGTFELSYKTKAEDNIVKEVPVTLIWTVDEREAQLAFPTAQSLIKLAPWQ